MKRDNSPVTIALIACAAMLCTSAGCGVTRTSNTARTATEQLLISDAIDRAVQEIDFSPLAGKEIFFDEKHLYDVVDDAYLISTFRQHLLASGCILKNDREQATFVVEPRAGAVGTDNHDLLFGIPQTNIPQFTLLAALPPAIPEIPIAKRRNQRGVAKIAVFAYRRESGEPAWQSGLVTSESTSNDLWVLGAGPFKRGTIHQGTIFAGDKLTKPKFGKHADAPKQMVQLRQEAVFPNTLSRPPVLAKEKGEGEVKQAAAEESVASPLAPAELATPIATTTEGPAVFAPPPSPALSEGDSSQ